MAADQDKKSKKKITKKLRLKYRLVIMDDETFQERLSLVLSPLNVIIVFGLISIFLIFSVVYLVAFTPLREYVPGYADVKTKQQVYYNAHRTDSLIRELQLRDTYLENLNNIITGDLPMEDVKEPDTTKKYSDIEFSVSKQDSILRARVEADERFNLQNLNVSRVADTEADISNIFFFAPLNGEVVDAFDINEEHYGVDLATTPDAPVKATLDGTVIMASWTYETGNVIAVQHAFGLTTFYKHNSVLLKKAGDVVKAGEAIAIAGNTGELTSGPHLHFELWHRGRPIDPAEHIIF